MLEKASPNDLLNSMVNKVSEIMAMMDLFEDSRPGSLAFTHFEEGMMWLQVLAHNIKLKPKQSEKEEEIVMD